MSESPHQSPSNESPAFRKTVAEPLASGAVHVVLPARAGSFSFVTDTPSPGREMIGPPPAYLAFAGWAA